MKNILDINFYKKNTVKVAKDLIGKKLFVGPYEGIIMETEAYQGSDDEASHAYRGITQRNTAMFGPPGHAYIYMIYGLHYCLNIVTEEMGQPGAVLIRGLLLSNETYLNGPGKLCKYLKLDKSYNGLSLIDNTHFYITEGIKASNIIVTPRIGIKKAVEKPWRFLMQIPPS